MPTDIAAVVNLHCEGTAATPSIISAWRAAESARHHGLATQLVLVLDRADSSTLELAEQWRHRGAQLVQADAGDLGGARNTAVTQVDAEWVAFLDGDDLWGDQWLWRAHQAASATPDSDGPEVWHPETNIIFGDHHSLLHHIDSTDPHFEWSRLRLHNAWTALSFVRRTTLADLPYPKNDLGSGFGFEDWTWNITVLERGGRHRIVPDTCHFIKRTNSDSLLARSQGALRSRPARPGPPPWRSPSPAEPMSSDRTEVDTHTHREAPVAVGRAVLDQVRTAATIAPEVEHTLRANGTPRSLPQNFNTHVTQAQRGLDLLEQAATSDPSQARTIGEIVNSCTQLDELDPNDRARVIAEFLLEERRLGRTEGSASWLDEVYSAFPQASA